jgi:hypothetical protein
VSILIIFGLLFAISLLITIGLFVWPGVERREKKPQNYHALAPRRSQVTPDQRNVNHVRQATYSQLVQASNQYLDSVNDISGR